MARTIAAIPPHLLVPFWVPQVHWNQNPRCLMRRQFNSLCIRHLRFPFRPSLDATILVPRVGGARTIYRSNSTPTLGTNSGTNIWPESESTKVPNAYSSILYALGTLDSYFGEVYVPLLVPRDGRTRTKSQPIFVNLAPSEVSTAAYDEQQTHLQMIVIVVDHGVWPLDFNNKNRLKNLEPSIFSLCSNRFIRPVSVRLLALPS
jgi:hypothetical protein